MSDLKSQIPLKIGFMRLNDAAPLIIAKEKGFFERNGLDVTLEREQSWAIMRDKLGAGMLEAAHMLAPMVPASWLDNTYSFEKFVTAFSMNLNGNAITVSNTLLAEIKTHIGTASIDGVILAKAFKAIIRERLLDKKETIRIGVVFPFSSHNYAVRYWLASEGIDPDRDVQIIVSNPDQLVEEMRNGKVDVFCVGEPWNTVAEFEKVGLPVLRSSHIWSHMPEKVLAVGLGWAQKNPDIHRALVKSLMMAIGWLQSPQSREEASDILASSDYLSLDVGAIAASLSQRTYKGNASIMTDDRALVFHENTANFPWRSHALWFLTQMARWGQVDKPINARALVANAYLPEVYRDAARELDMAYSLEDFKADGVDAIDIAGSNGLIKISKTQFFDDRSFNPDQVISYMEGFLRHNFKIDLQDFVAPTAP